MIREFFFIGVTFFMCSLLSNVNGHYLLDPPDKSMQVLTHINLNKVRLLHPNSVFKNYGILILHINSHLYTVCDDMAFLQNKASSFQHAAKVACVELGFKDGRFQPGSVLQKILVDMQSSIPVMPLDIQCHGNETMLSKCSSLEKAACHSNKYVVAYCSNTTIVAKAKMDLRIVEHQKFGTLEANLYGFYGPICAKHWTNLEASASCRHLNFTGGLAYYGKSLSDQPMVLGRFNCSGSNRTFNECSYRGITEDLGCQNKVPAAGALCFNHEGGVHFRLTDRWHGSVQVQYEGKWGRICNTGWTNTDAQVMCRQLGYKDGRIGISNKISPEYDVYMDNVKCAGTENSILECDHVGYWEPGQKSCFDAAVMCDITICGSMDIRNEVDNLARLTNCTIIEGSLSILLIESTKPEEYLRYTFPNLVEITEYLLLFRADGLRSLRNLFPNLAIIRGHQLFHNYALVAFEMEDLSEIGLASLVTIPRGAVRLEKNPKLCYIHTVDWMNITTGVSKTDNYFKGNKGIGECVDRCPRGCSNCWTINDCQRNLDCGSRRCASGICDRDHCCDSNCIGGCTGESPNQCTACKNVAGRSDGVSRCMEHCLPGTYKYLEHRCLFDKECLNFADYRILSQKTMKLMNLMNLKLVIDQGTCTADCPSGYNIDSTNTSLCVKCQGRCPKVCPPMVIDNVNAVQSIGDCNIIDGPLIIKLMGGNQIGQEFEKNFAQIEEVTHYIKISSSSPLVSLHFLKGLKVIGGKNLEQNKYALYVFDNVNLEELFLDNVASNLSIKNGTVFFQSNPKLCYKKISEFVEAIKMDIKTMSREDISKDTNGHQTPCLTQELIYSVVNVSPHIAFLSWLKINITDERQLIGYVMHWKVAPDKNVSIYKGRDACSTDQWFSKEIDNKASNSSVIQQYIVELEAYTQYATYVEARMTSTAVENAVSKVIYFRTAAEVPSNPTNLKVIADMPGELHIKWDEPKKPNGNVTHYEIYWQHRNLDRDEYELRNYCSSPLTSSSQKNEDVEVKINITMNDTCCPQYCPKSEKKRLEEEQERNFAIAFQDYIQNMVYIKRLDQGATTMTSKISTRNTQRQNLISPVSGMFKYSVTMPTSVGRTTPSFGSSKDTSNWTYTTNLTTGTTSAPPIKTQSDNPYMKSDVYETNEFIIPNLGHFEDYNIEVIACHSRPDDIRKEMLCSSQALAYGRTLPNPTADNLNSSLIHIEQIKNNTRALYITWKDPPHPNGLILMYEIEFRKDNIDRTKPDLICIPYVTYRDEGKYGYILDHLDPGKYLIRIRATSLAGNGSWTDYVPFNIPATGETATMISTVVGVATIFVILVSVLVYLYMKRKFTKKREAITSPNPDYMQDAYEPDEWEVDRDNVQLLEELGQGSFGMVYKGLVKNLSDDGQPIKVAVKTTNAKSNDYDRYMFLQEASIMKQFNCCHVVKLIGVVSREQPAYVLMELMPLGDLKNFLRLHRPDEEDNDGRSPPSLHQILQMAGEIADGMAYLADKKYVHRDLAARNCMVGEDMTVKIGDFGMTRDIYETDYYRKGSRGLLPVRWMAPESLKDGVFTSMTDVWSYGVVLWEMATLAAQPYQGLSNEAVLRYVGSGEIMDKPEGCPQRLYTLMIKCWKYRPQQRLSFKGIIQNLIPDLDKNFHEMSYFFSQQNVRCDENRDNDDDVDDDDVQDGAHEPMLGSQLRNNNQFVEMVDIFNDSGMYPSYNNSHQQHVGSAEFSDGTASQDFDGGACASAQSMDFKGNTEYSSPNSAMGGSSDGSKDSKASSNSYAHMNGLSVGNGHVSVHLQMTSC